MDKDLKAQLLKGTGAVSFCPLNDTGVKMWCFGCGRGGIFLYRAHIGRSWHSCIPALVSAELLHTGGLFHETRMPCSPWVLPTHLTQARVPSLPLNPSLCCPASGQRPCERTQHSQSMWETALDMQTSPKAQEAELPISEASPRVFATLSPRTKSSISTKHRIPHHTFPFLLQWEVFLPGMGGVWRRPRSAAVALLSSADAGSRHGVIRL